MRPLHAVLLVLASSLFPCCMSIGNESTSTPPSRTQSPQQPQQPANAEAPKPKTEAEAKAEAEKKAEERAAKEKELRLKRRELEYANTEKETAAIDRKTREMGLEAQAKKVALELEKAQKELKLFLEEHRPRQLEEKKISLDQQTYYAEHSKDELGELEAMYQADEFAKTTKELVLKRGRRQLEMAERSLAVAKKENEIFAAHTLPDRERDLKQKVADAGIEVEKQALEARKAKIDLDLAARKLADRIQDLERDIQEIEKKLAKDAEAAQEKS